MNFLLAFGFVIGFVEHCFAQQCEEQWTSFEVKNGADVLFAVDKDKARTVVSNELFIDAVNVGTQLEVCNCVPCGRVRVAIHLSPHSCSSFVSTLLKRKTAY